MFFKVRSRRPFQTSDDQKGAGCVAVKLVLGVTMVGSVVAQLSILYAEQSNEILAASFTKRHEKLTTRAKQMGLG